MKNLITEQEYKLALKRGRAELEKPHAIEADILARGTLLRFKFSNGLSLTIETRKVPAFEGLDMSKLGNPVVTPGGDGIIFDAAQLAFNLPNLIALFLPLEWARSRVAAELGKVSTLKKAQAARENGSKGGRPRKPVKVLSGLISPA